MKLCKHFAVFGVILFLSILIHPNIVQAQQEETAHIYEAQFSNLGPPTNGEVIKNNIGKPETIKSELDIWERDLGSIETQGSYVGPLFESSTFEIDFISKKTEQPFTYYPSVAMTQSWKPEDLQAFQDSVNVPLQFYNAWPDLYHIYALNLSLYDTYDYANNLPGEGTSFPVAKERSIVSFTQIVNFSNRVIMSGSTEFWIKIPINPSCIDFNDMMPTISMTSIDENFDSTKLSLKGRHKIVYSPVPSQTNWLNYINKEGYWVEPSEIGRVLKQYSNYETLYMSYNNRIPDVYQQVTEKKMYTDSLYTLVYAPIEPNQNYLISFSAIYKSKPLIYITEDDLYNEGRESTFHISNIEFDTTQNRYYSSTIGDLGISPVVEVFSSVTPPVEYSKNIPIDLSFSFIFKSGRGSHGMYGQSFYMKENDSLVFYDDVQAKSNKFISMMIPFISDKSIEVDITTEFIDYNHRFESSMQSFVYLLPNYITYGEWENITTFLGLPWWWYVAWVTPLTHPLYAHPIPEDTFVPSEVLPSGYVVNYSIGYKSPFWWQSEKTMIYNDYILFTIPYKPVENFNGILKTTITFTKATNITFMFSTLNPIDKIKQATITTQGLYDNYFGTSGGNLFGTSTAHLYTEQGVRYKLTYIYNDVKKYPIFYWGHQYKNDRTTFFHGCKGVEHKRYIEDINQVDIIQSELFRSVSMTDGRWHEIATSSSGHVYATSYFERKISLGVQKYFVDTTNRSSEVKINWYDSAVGKYEMAWEYLKKGDILNFVRYALEGSISLLWNGMTAFSGWIKGIFEKVWDALKGFGSFIKTILLEFWDKIVSIVGDLIRNVSKIIEVALYVIALIIFAYVVSWSARFINLTTGGLDEL